MAKQHTTLIDEVTLDEIYPNIEPENIPENAIDSNNIKDNAIISSKIANEAVTFYKIADYNVGTKKIMDGSITNAKLDNDSVGYDNIINNSINDNKIQYKSLTRNSIADNTLLFAANDNGQHRYYYRFILSKSNFRFCATAITSYNPITSGTITLEQFKDIINNSINNSCLLTGIDSAVIGGNLNLINYTDISISGSSYYCNGTAIDITDGSASGVATELTNLLFTSITIQQYAQLN